MRTLVLAVALLTGVTPAEAQRIGSPVAGGWATPDPASSHLALQGRERSPNNPALIALGGAAGFGLSVAGALAIPELHGDGVCGDAPCGFYAAGMFFFLTEPLLVPLGAYLANGAKGDYGTSLGLSLGAALVMGLAGSQLQTENGEILIPLGQIAAAVAGKLISTK